MIQTVEEALAKYKDELRKYKQFFNDLDNPPLPDGSSRIYIPTQDFDKVWAWSFGLKGMAYVLGLTKADKQKIFTEVGIDEKIVSLRIEILDRCDFLLPQNPYSALVGESFDECCLLPKYHEGDHLVRLADEQYLLWSPDHTCGCRDSCNCITYNLISEKDAHRLLLSSKPHIT